MAAHLASPTTHRDIDAESARYGEQFADYCEVEDRRVGLPPAMSAAARAHRVTRGTTMAREILLSAVARG